MEHIIGIDLGTTNSEVAVFVDGKIEIVKKSGKALLPSYVGISQDGDLLVGEEARNQYCLFPENTIKSIKRKMGTNEEIVLGENTYFPQDISAILLKELRNRAEEFLGEKVTKAVITVPAQFSDAQRQATREAGEIAGLEVLRIINEPTAASLAYKNNEDDGCSTILVFDLGGGTFDVSLVKMEGKLIEVVSSHGNNKLGGDDFDKRLADWIVKNLLKKKKNKLSVSSKYRLNRLSENAKVHLSDFTQANIIDSNLEMKNSDKKLNINGSIFRNEFESLIGDYLNETIIAVHQTLADAKIKKSDIDEIILVGGSTRIPAVSNILKKEFGKSPRSDVHPDLAVAYGAGVMAARLMGRKEQRVLIDITPYTFGVSCVGELDGDFCPYLFAPIITGGSPLPVVKEELFNTMLPGQKQIEVNIFQGENKDVRKNILIGRFIVEDLDENSEVENVIAMNMQLNLDGILKVTAREVETGLTKHISVENTLTKLSDSQINKSKLEVLRLFGEQNDDDIIDIEPNDVGTVNKKYDKVVDELKARIDKIRCEMSDEDRVETDGLLKDLLLINKNEEPEKFDSLVEKIEDILFYLEVE